MNTNIIGRCQHCGVAQFDNPDADPALDSMAHLCWKCVKPHGVIMPGMRVRLAGSPGYTGMVVRRFKPMLSGNTNVLVKWDSHGDNGIPTSVLDSQLESVR